MKKLETDVAYFVRFMSDLQKIKHKLDLYSAKSYDDACNDIFSNVRKYCELEISKVINIDKDAALQIQNFSNHILHTVSQVREINQNQNQKIIHQTELVDELLLSTSYSRDILEKEIDELNKNENIHKTLNTQPPIHKKPETVSSREKSKKVSERKDNN